MDIKKIDYQFMIRHISSDRFTIGEKVFLKSNIEFEMTVIGFKDGLIEVSIKENNHYFKPEMLLQYRYSALLMNNRRQENLRELNLRL